MPALDRPEDVTSPIKCRNCEHPLDPDARHCSQCGQKVTDGLPTVRELFGQFVDEVLSLDSRFVRSFALLLARPGRLTREYLEGRQQRYVRPLRMYLVSSLVFFLVATWSGVDPVEINSGDRAAREAGPTATDGDRVASDEDVEQALRDASFEAPVRNRLRATFGEAGLDSSWVRALAPPDTTDGWFESMTDVPLVGGYLQAQGRQLDRMSGEEFDRALSERLLRDLPRVIFLMVPVFAAILALVYRRRRRRYAEHFVFALHGHTVAFIGFLALALIEWTPLDVAVAAFLAVHAVLSLRTVYAQGWAKTLVKVGLVTALYSTSMLIALAVAGVIAVVTI